MFEITTRRHEDLPPLPQLFGARTRIAAWLTPGDSALATPAETFPQEKYSNTSARIRAPSHRVAAHFIGSEEELNSGTMPPTLNPVSIDYSLYSALPSQDRYSGVNARERAARGAGEGRGTASSCFPENDRTAPMLPENATNPNSNVNFHDSGLSPTPNEKSLFQMLKPHCVPLLASSRITPLTTPTLLTHLSSLLTTLTLHRTHLTPPLIEYAFFPISTLLQRNPIERIPNAVLEGVLKVLGVLFEVWWWECSMRIWEQVLMLAAGILSGITSESGSSSFVRRDEETKEACICLLHALLRLRKTDENEQPVWSIWSASQRNETITLYATTQTTLYPVIGKALDASLACTQAERLSLRLESLRVTRILLDSYIPSSRIPAVLPGVVSTMCHVALGRKVAKGWQNGDIVQEALDVLATVIIKSIGDVVCIESGIISDPLVGVHDLADLANLVSTLDMNPPPASTNNTDPHAFQRSLSWLKATAAQLHMAINSLTPLLTNPTPTVQISLANLSSRLLRETTQTLPTLHPLLLTILLELSLSPFPATSQSAENGLIQALSSENSSNQLLNTLYQITQETLFTLPALILSRTGDAKLERSANQITALCQLARHVHLKPISSRIAKLLGPNGGIEKWGTSLLGVLELTVPAIIPIGPSPVGLIMSALEAPAVGHPFPRMGFRYMSATSTVVSLERMFQSLGRVGAVEALFAVEWLVDVAIRGEKSARAAALWCAVRVLEGIGGTVLAQHAEFGVESRDAEGDRQPEWMSSVRRRMEKATRMIVKNVCGMWEPGAEDDDQDVSAQPTASTDPLGDSMLPTEYVKGFAPLTTLIAGTRGSSEEGRPSKTHQDQRVIQYALALQMLSICASILGSLFPPLLLHSLYPILRSIVSSHAILSETAMAALYHVTNAAAYASPGNLLLANFDYALDSTSRRLLRRQLDVKATKVLVLLVRLVGKDVVKRAGDVVEECFDRLDEYHGYGIVVEGLVEVLQEVVKAVELDEDVSHEDDVDPTPLLDKGAGRFTKFVEWYQGRNRSDESSKEEYGPAPREAWGKTKSVDPVAPQSTQEADTTKKPTPTQELISKIIKRCLAFLTHPSALIRTRILSVLRSSVTVLPAEEIQPSIHKAWPFVLNRLKDGEVYVVAEAAGLIETLAAHAGVFMSARVCDDVWPTYRKMLDGLEAGDRSNALAAARGGGPRTVYSASHRLHRAILSTMRSVFRGVHGGGWIKDDVVWQVAVRCRGFLDVSVNEELQAVARGLFMEIAKHNDDLVWMVLSCTMADDVEGRKRDEEKSERQRQVGVDGSCVSFLKEPKWDIMNSASLVL